MSRPVRVLVTPLDGNPYQSLLYDALQDLGVTVRYDDGPTSSQSINLLLLPATLARFRVAGFRVLHVHWVFKFQLPWARNARWARGLMQAWFALYLAVARLLGFRIVWTAHDLVPHTPVFADDAAATRRLARAADVVVALSEVTKRQVEKLGARAVKVVPFGSYGPRYAAFPGTREGARASVGVGADDLVFVWFGKLERYKGVDDLLVAAARLRPDLPVRVVVAGECLDDVYRSQLKELATAAGGRVVARFERVPEEELSDYLRAADFAAFPFREVTNSSSVLLALGFGVPVLVPRLGNLADLPDACVLRYTGGVAELVATIESACALPPEQMEKMRRGARDFADSTSWASVAATMLAIYEDLLESPVRRAGPAA